MVETNVILILAVLLIVSLPAIIFIILFLGERKKNKQQKLIIDSLEGQLRAMQERVSGTGEVKTVEQLIQPSQLIQPAVAQSTASQSAQMPVQSGPPAQAMYPIKVEPIQVPPRQPVQSAQPGQLAQPAQSVQSGQPAQPGQPVQSAPPGQPVQSAPPVFIQPQRSPEQSRQNARNILLWLGVVFVTIAGCVFATTQWQIMNDMAKVIIIMGTVALFFGLSVVSTKVLKIEQTGKAFYTLGCVFLPISLIASAYFHLFGSWFTYVGDGYWLFWATCSILLAVSLGVGVCIYHKRWIFMLMLFCISIAVGCVIEGNVHASDMAQLWLSLYLALLALASAFVKNQGQYKRSIDIFTKCHFYGLGIPFLLMVTDVTFLNLLAVLIALASLLLLYKKTDAKGYRNCFLCYYLLLFVIIREVSADNFSNLIVGVCIVVSFLIFHFATVKKLAVLRTGLADGLVIGVGILAIVDNSLQRWYRFGSIFKAGEILCIILTMFVVLWIILERDKKSYAKGVAFLMPLLVAVLVEAICDGDTRARTIMWLIGLSVVGLAMVIRLLKNRLSWLRLLDLPFFIATILAMLICFVPSLGSFGGMSEWTYLVSGYTLSAVYFGVRGAIDNKEKKTLQVTIMSIAMLSATTISAFGILTAINEWADILWIDAVKYRFLVVSIFLAIVFFIGIVSKDKCEKSSRTWTRFASIVMIIATSSMTYFNNQSFMIDTIYMLVTLICLGLAIWMAFYSKITLLAIPTVLMFIYTLNHQLGINIEVGIVILSIEAIATMLLSRALFPDLFLASEKGKRFYRFDILIVATLFLIGWMMLLGTRADITIALVFLALFFLNFYKRELGHTLQSVMITLAGTSLLLAWWIQPWLDIPEVIEMELMVMPVIALALILQLFVWKRHRVEMENMVFVCAILGVVILIADALDSQWLFDVMFLGITSLAVLLYSFYFKRKKWFYYAVVVLLVLAIYMTRQFWLSMAWWAYLLIVGVLLIAIAAWNERLKQKGTSIKNRATRLWEDWTW